MVAAKPSEDTGVVEEVMAETTVLPVVAVYKVAALFAKSAPVERISNKIFEVPFHAYGVLKVTVFAPTACVKVAAENTRFKVLVSNAVKVEAVVTPIRTL